MRWDGRILEEVSLKETLVKGPKFCIKSTLPAGE